jgi:hypothetical protein
LPVQHLLNERRVEISVSGVGGQRDRGSIGDECGGDDTDGATDLVLEQLGDGLDTGIIEGWGVGIMSVTWLDCRQF